MPPGWMVPIKGSDPHERKQKIRKIVDDNGGTMHCFWKEEGGSTCWALVEMDDPRHLDDEKEPDRDAVSLRRI
jgi:hypothetical protein